MAITISGSGITSSEIADGTIVSGDIADGTIVNADINSSAAITASKLTGAGKVLQVVTSADISSQATSTSTSFSDTGVTATITPSSVSSKILAVASGSFSIAGTSYNSRTEHRILRASTGIATVQHGYDYYIGSAPANGLKLYFDLNLSSLDSPSTTSAVTYTIQHRMLGTNYSATSVFPVDTSSYSGCRITLIEVAV